MDNKYIGIVQLQVMGKIISRNITLEDKNHIMQQMLEKDCDFLLIDNTFFNKNVISIIDFPVMLPQQEVKNNEIR